MAYITQDYPIGQNFNLSTQAQLSAQDGVWKWDRRTLSGFITEDGKFIEPGGIANFNTQTADVSGVWTLHKDVPISLCCLGNSGEISVEIEEYSNWEPLADNSHPYRNSFTLTTDAKLSTYYGTIVYFTIIPAEGTLIKSIYQSGWSGKHTQKDYVFDNDDSTNYVLYANGAVLTTHYLSSNTRYMFIGKRRTTQNGQFLGTNLILSVDYTNQGVLSYIPKKGVYIPTPDNPTN